MCHNYGSGVECIKEMIKEVSFSLSCKFREIVSSDFFSFLVLCYCKFIYLYIIFFACLCMAT